jgi:hypothetical protein
MAGRIAAQMGEQGFGMTGSGFFPGLEKSKIKEGSADLSRERRRNSL